MSKRGSHVKLRKEANRTVIVPMHRRVGARNVAFVLREADLTVEGFTELL